MPVAAKEGSAPSSLLWAKKASFSLNIRICYYQRAKPACRTGLRCFRSCPPRDIWVHLALFGTRAMWFWFGMVWACSERHGTPHHATEEGLAVDYFVSHFWGHPFEVGSCWLQGSVFCAGGWFGSWIRLVVHLVQDKHPL